MGDVVGRLLVCATPIGNLGDVTLRVLDALREADLIAAEDTRVTARLLHRYAINTPMQRYDAHTASRQTAGLVERMASGQTVALVSDAGTPGMSDPGELLVLEAIRAGIEVDVLPGPCAAVTALIFSGAPTRAFYFGGFLPRKAGDRRRLLESIKSLDATLVFYESPHRAASSLAAIAEIMPGRHGAVARELTKVHQEILRGETELLAKALADRVLKGELVLVVAPPPAEARPSFDESSIREALERQIAHGVSRSDAIKIVAKETGLARSEVYKIAHER